MTKLDECPFCHTKGKVVTINGPLDSWYECLFCGREFTNPEEALEEELLTLHREAECNQK